MYMYAVSVWNNYILKESTTVLVSEVTEESIKKVIAQWDIFSDTKLIIYDDDSDRDILNSCHAYYDDEYTQNKFSRWITQGFRILSTEYPDRNKFERVFDFPDSDFKDYNVSIQRLKVV